MENGSETLIQQLDGALQVEGDQVTVVDQQKLREQIDNLAYKAVFGEGIEREEARWLIWEAGQSLGIKPASIHDLYIAIGKGSVPHNFTVPAINVRAVNYSMSRAIFRAANALDVGAMLFEIARSEMGYTDQRPAEYVTVVIAAAIKEGFNGPIFIQGDHFQISLSRYASDPAKEIASLRDLIKEAVEAGFYNIDIDTSTLVDLEPEGLDAQQEKNYTECARLTEYVREIEPEGVTVSVGGEIGEVGGHNSTVLELRAFMEGYNRTLSTFHPNLQGISKISVQTGTSHGGVVNPDGTLADVKVDFETLEELSRLARDEYGLGGAVQHGASTLPPEAFNKFPEIGTVEIHLATGFQNIIFDTLSEDTAARAYEYVRANLQSEMKSGMTEDQFLYSARKKAIGPLKREWWDLPEEEHGKIGQALQQQFEFLFDKLNVKNSKQYVSQTIHPPTQHRPRPTQAVEETELEVASDLSD